MRRRWLKGGACGLPLEVPRNINRNHRNLG